MNRLVKSEISGLVFFNWKVLAAVAVLIGVMLVLFWPTLLWMNERFFEEHSYYGHGWLIPPAIAFLLYQRREVIIRNHPRPGWYGLVILIPGILLYLFAQLFGIKKLNIYHEGHEEKIKELLNYFCLPKVLRVLRGENGF